MDSKEKTIDLLKNDKSEKICKNCKDWESYGEKIINGDILGCCNKVKMYNDSVTKKQNEEYDIIDTLKESCKNDLFFVQDAESYRAVLLTFPNFGCNQFIANEIECGVDKKYLKWQIMPKLMAALKTNLQTMRNNKQ
jgi:hypothetical protein